MVGRDYTVITPENVALRYEIAGIGSRFLALLIDSFLQAAVILGIYYGLELLGIDSLEVEIPISSFSISLLTGLLLLGVFFVIFGYHFFFELTMNGQTIGKRIAGIRVRQEGGYAPGFWNILLRNLIRPIDFFPSFYGLGFVAMFLSKKAKRLGDYAAGTIVVKELPTAKLKGFLAAEENKEDDEEKTTGEEAELILKYPWLSQVIAALTLDDYKILRELCLRRKTLTNFSSLAREALTQIVARFTQADPITYERAGVKMQFMSEDEFEKILRVIMDRWEGV
jgi:uncharacterized RDD family membrane protein YckC